MVGYKYKMSFQNNKRIKNRSYEERIKRIRIIKARENKILYKKSFFPSYMRKFKNTCLSVDDF